ncbi:MAG: hypothetical protein M3Z32_05845 [Acidobacteriota bacterium]|nr:hypothetical protein [Acidobacteriota bacterium]
MHLSISDCRRSELASILHPLSGFGPISSVKQPPKHPTLDEGSSATFGTTDRESNQRMHFFVFVAIKYSEGKILKKFTLDRPYEVPQARFAAFRSSAFTFTRPITLPRGAFTLETVVFDREAKTVSASSIPVERSAPLGGLVLSTPVLVQKVQAIQGQPEPGDLLVLDGKRLTPQLAREIAPDTKPQVYFVVHPDRQNQASPSITIAFVSEGKELAKQSSSLPSADSTGAIPMTITAVAQPGNCELRITAVQGSDSVTRSVTYSVPASFR